VRHAIKTKATITMLKNFMAAVNVCSNDISATITIGCGTFSFIDGEGGCLHERLLCN